MPASSLILIGILTPCSGIIGSLVWPRIQKKLGWTNLKVLVLLVVVASLIPAYGCLGFLFEGADIKFGGLTTPGEMYALAVVFGESPFLRRRGCGSLAARLCVRGFPGLRSCLLCGTHTTRRGSPLVWPLLYYRQGELLGPSSRNLLTSPPVFILCGPPHCRPHSRYNW